ncbi:hypothetical protein HRbin19_00733 [bacterium HR19]|nr:hypothetical protein HRbin19_00733 [bacterium HR19]
MPSRKNDRLSRVERLVEKIAVEIRQLREFQKETTEQIRELRESQKKTDEQLRKTDEQLRKSDEKVNKITDSWGRFVEGMVSPSAEEFMRKKGFSDVRVHPRTKVSKNGKNAEYDTLVVSRDKKFILLVSAKTYAKSRDVDDLLEDMKNFEYFMGEDFPGYTLCGAIAGISFGEGVEKYAKRKGLILFKVSGEVMTAEEPKKLKLIKIEKNKR